MCKNSIIILATYKPRALTIARDMLAFLQQKHIATDIYEYDGLTSYDPIQKNYNFAVSLGGDGTVLFTARYCASKKIPVFPVNLGEFGFIASIEPDKWRSELEAYLDGMLDYYERMLLSIAIFRNQKCVGTFKALNDVVVSGQGIAKLIHLLVSFNGISFGTYQADGVIVSTPTGSTAYSAASGGPILDPAVSAFVLTPISAFSLSNRPIVLPAFGTLCIQIQPNRQKNPIVSIDGQELFALHEGDRVEVCMSEHRVRLIGCSPQTFYTALRSKLVWSGSFHKGG